MPKHGRTKKPTSVNAIIPTSDEATWYSILRLLQSSWFKRLWIWQEITLAKPNALVQCGEEGLSWDDFCTAIGYLHWSDLHWSDCEVPSEVCKFCIRSYFNSTLSVMFIDKHHLSFDYLACRHLNAHALAMGLSL